MAFEIDDRKHKKSGDLWHYESDEIYAEPVKEPDAPPGQRAEAVKKPQKKGTSANLSGAETSKTFKQIQAARGKVFTEGSSKSKKTALIIIMVVMIVSVAFSILPFVLIRYRYQKAERIVESDNYLERKSRVELLFKSLPYPKGYTYKKYDGQMLVAPYKLKLYLEGDARADREDFLTTAIFAMRGVEGLSEVTFVLEDTGEEFTFRSGDSGS